jgi:hypothetical protein
MTFHLFSSLSKMKQYTPCAGGKQHSQRDGDMGELTLPEV